MKILILANLDMGLYKFRRELLEALVKEHEVYFCTPDGEFTSKMQALGCKFISCNVLERRSVNPIKDLKLISFYKKIIKSLEPDVALTYTIKPNVYGGIVCGMEKIPYIVNVTGLGTTIENGGILSWISINLYKIGLKKATCVFFQNAENRNLFLKYRVVSGKTRLIPGSGVNLNHYDYESYPSDEKGIRFLFVGRIMKDKGIEELLQAIRILHRERNDVILDVVGFCDENYSTLLTEVEKEGAIINHGVQGDVRPYYASCHCTVLPSYHEGMANVMLESSATGRPVITTRVPGCRETFEEGITGFGCEVKNMDSLLDAMRKFLFISQSKREEMGILARKKIEKEYDRTIVINAYKEEISNAI